MTIQMIKAASGHPRAIGAKMSELTKEEANAKLTELVGVAYTALEAAEAFADEHGLSFTWSPFYGGGGSYCSKAKYVKEYMEPGTDPETVPDTNKWGEPTYGWRSSSDGC